MGILEMILLIVLIMFILGAVPAWPHSRNWGYVPSSSLATLLIIVLLFILFF